MGQGPAAQAQSESRRSERQAAAAIRKKQQERDQKQRVADMNLPPAERTMRNRPSAPQLTAGQAAAGARAAGQAQNEASIQELRARLSDARNPISKINLENQIKQLQQGGVPVVTQKSGGPGTRYGGETLTVGVVRGGRYYGRAAYDPARGGTGKTSTEGFYTVKNKVALANAMTSGASNSDPSVSIGNRGGRNSSQAAADAASKNIVTAARPIVRASAGASSAARRRFYSRNQAI